MRKYEQQALAGTLLLAGLWVWWRVRRYRLEVTEPLRRYKRQRKDLTPLGDSEWMIEFRKDVAKDRHKQKLWGHETKRRRRETSAQEKAWEETMIIWNNPAYVRQHRHVENAAHARMWDKRADEANRSRFMGHTRNPLPDEIHGMEKEEQLQLIDNELVHLRHVQAQTKDAIDLWVKGGSDTTIQLMSPQTQHWAWPNQVEFENLEILEEISRLEQMKRYILDLPF